MVDAFIPDSSRRGTGKCFGFVRFRGKRLAMKCIEALNGSRVIGRMIVVKIASYGWSQRRKRSGTDSGE